MWFGPHVGIYAFDTGIQSCLEWNAANTIACLIFIFWAHWMDKTNRRGWIVVDNRVHANLFPERKQSACFFLFFVHYYAHIVLTRLSWLQSRLESGLFIIWRSIAQDIWRLVTHNNRELVSLLQHATAQRTMIYSGLFVKCSLFMFCSIRLLLVGWTPASPSVPIVVHVWCNL